MSAGDLDELFWAKPDGFIALRTKLSAAAKGRDDREAARQISATNKPTTAAWVVNRLVIGHRDVEQRIADLGDRLRAAHAAMDGDQIRDLSGEQRQLIDELARTGLAAAELENPSAAVRDDVAATLQAAIADVDVAAMLGRLTRPQRWSGFGGFGQATTGRRSGSKSRATRQREEKLSAALAEAERTKAAADDAIRDRQAELAQARSQHTEARDSLRTAERRLRAAEKALEKSERASRTAADVVQQTKARLRSE